MDQKERDALGKSQGEHQRKAQPVDRERGAGGNPGQSGPEASPDAKGDAAPDHGGQTAHTPGGYRPEQGR